MKRLLAVAMIVVLLPGCAWQQAQRQGDFDALYAAGDFPAAAELAKRHGGDGYSAEGGGDLLWTLQRATALQGKGQHDQSIALFDETEDFFRIYDLEGELSRWLRQTGALLVNDAALPYRGTLYDAVMVNTYKALGFLAQGDADNARVELNRARDRQRRAVEVFQAQIQAQQEALDARREEGGQADIGGTLDNAHQALSEDYERLARWRVYPDYVNPLATWLEGLFLMTHAQAPGDFNRAADALERVAGMVPDNDAVRVDWEWAEALAAGRKRHRELPPTVWVLYEKGQGPVKFEQQIQLPVVIRHGGTPTIYTGFAYPMLRYRMGLAGRLTLEGAAAGNGSEAALLSNMDAVISTEFQEELSRIVARAVAASVARAVVQYQLQNQFGDFAGFVGLLYQLFSTQADTRIWSALPKHFEVGRWHHEPGETVTLNWAGERREIRMPEERFVLIWVRQPTVTARPMVEVIPLGTEQ